MTYPPNRNVNPVDAMSRNCVSPKVHLKRESGVVEKATPLSILRHAGVTLPYWC